MAEKLTNQKIAFLVTDGFEQSEMTTPWQAVKTAGGEPVLVSIKTGTVQGTSGHEKADTFEVDTTVEKTSASEFDGLVLPGGLENPDTLRMNAGAVEFTKEFFQQNKPIAAICHGPWMLVEAGAVQGRTLTSWSSLKTDITNAGGHWVEKEVCLDNGLVTSRNPGDLNAFCHQMVEAFAHGKQAAHVA